MTSLRRDVRGATLVEYIILVGVIGLVALLGYRVFGDTVSHRAQAEAACVGSLDPACSSGARGGASSSTGSISSGSAATGTASAAVTSSGSTASGNSQPGPITRAAVAYAKWQLATDTYAVKEIAKEAKDLVVLGASATPPGLAYSAITGKPNKAVETTKALGKLALSASLPGRIVAWSGGPDPFGKTIDATGSTLKKLWRENKAEFVGRGGVMLGTMLLPLGDVGAAAKTAEVAEATTKVEQATRIAEVASDAEKAATGAKVAEGAADAAKIGETESVARAIAGGAEPRIIRQIAGGDIMTPGGDYSAVYLGEVNGSKVAVKVSTDANVSLGDFAASATPTKYGGVPVYGTVKVTVDGKQVEGLAMKYIDGSTLDSAFNNPAKAARVTDEHIAELEHLKAQADADRVIYSSPKSDNVMIGRDGHVYIIDNSVTPIGAAPPSGIPQSMRFDVLIGIMKDVQKRQLALPHPPP